MNKIYLLRSRFGELDPAKGYVYLGESNNDDGMLDPFDSVFVVFAKGDPSYEDIAEATQLQDFDLAPLTEPGDRVKFKAKLRFWTMSRDEVYVGRISLCAISLSTNVALLSRLGFTANGFDPYGVAE